MIRNRGFKTFGAGKDCSPEFEGGDFTVTCDETNNSQRDIKKGIVNMNVELKFLRPRGSMIMEVKMPETGSEK